MRPLTGVVRGTAPNRVNSVFWKLLVLPKRRGGRKNFEERPKNARIPGDIRLAMEIKLILPIIANSEREAKRAVRHYVEGEKTKNETITIDCRFNQYLHFDFTRALIRELVFTRRFDLILVRNYTKKQGKIFRDASSENFLTRDAVKLM